MFTMDWFLGMMRQGYNPQQVMMSVLEARMKGTPMGDNLINLARSGNTKGIEQIARNYASQRGVDFDKEFTAFRQKYRI